MANFSFGNESGSLQERTTNQSANSIRIGPVTFAFDGHVLDLRIEEAFLQGECLHDLLWLAIRDAVKQCPSASVVLIDFSNVKQVTSLTVSVLLRTKTHLCRQGETFGLFGMNASIREIFKTMRLDEILSISESREQLVSREKPHTYFEAHPLSEIQDFTEVD